MVEDPTGCWCCAHSTGENMPKKHEPGRMYKAGCNAPGRIGGVQTIWMTNLAHGRGLCEYFVRSQQANPAEPKNDSAR